MNHKSALPCRKCNNDMNKLNSRARTKHRMFPHKANIMCKNCGIIFPYPLRGGSNRIFCTPICGQRYHIKFYRKTGAVNVKADQHGSI